MYNLLNSILFAWILTAPGIWDTIPARPTKGVSEVRRKYRDHLPYKK